MEVLQRTANRGSVSTGYNIDNSIKLEDANDEYLTRTNASGTNRRTWTVSLWCKRTKLSTADGLVMELWDGGVYSEATRIGFGLNNDEIWYDIGYSTKYRGQSTPQFTDTNAWYHIVWKVDTTQSTEADRSRIYVNGEEITEWESRQYPTQNFDTSVASGLLARIGSYDASYHGFHGYIAEFNYLDGLAVAPTEFGEVDGDTGIWIPKEYTGSYPGQSAYLDFKDGSNLGANPKGDDTDWTEVNLAAADQSTDTPTNNFCTWSPLWAEGRANGTISEGATQVAWGGSAWKIARSSMAVSKGRWYWEIKAANVTGDTWNNNLFGFASVEGENGQYGPTVLIGYSTGNYYYRVDNSQTSDSSTGWDSGGAWSSSDTFGFALDLESSTKKFILYRNGSAVNGSGTDLVSAFQTEQFFTPYATSYNGDTQFLNFGGYTVNTISSAASDANGYGTFEYAPPSGYYALCTKNLAEFG